MVTELIESWTYKGSISLSTYAFLLKVLNAIRPSKSDRDVTNEKFRKVFGRDMDFENPQTLNEKIQWLKLNFRKDIQVQLADKFEVRKFVEEKFGPQYLVPLLYQTTDWRDITMENIPNEPCIIKPNHASGRYIIIRDKKTINLRKIQTDCISWLSVDYYKHTQEWQYKDIKRRIIIEKLLQTKEGTIPNDYKLHYFNGELGFVYCSVGRESENKRNIYDPEWNPLYFSWVEPFKDSSSIRGQEIPEPPTYEKMKEIGAEIAKMFAYVRVDFYDVDGKLYLGEITFHHGSGFDVFVPKEYDLYWGNKVTLPFI